MAISRISDLTPGAIPVVGPSLFEVSVPNAAAPSGYDSRKYSVANIFGQVPVTIGALQDINISGKLLIAGFPVLQVVSTNYTMLSATDSTSSTNRCILLASANTDDAAFYRMQQHQFQNATGTVSYLQISDGWFDVKQQLFVRGAATLSAGGTSTTPATADNSTAIATTAFVKAQGYGAAVTFPITTTQGGTGLITYAQGDIIYASATDTLARLAKNVTATRYISNTGTNNAPAWAQINLVNGVTGTLPIANGGTGATSTSVALSNLGAVPLAGGNITGTLSVSSPVPADNTFASLYTANITLNNSTLFFNAYTGSSGSVGWKRENNAIPVAIWVGGTGLQIQIAPAGTAGSAITMVTALQIKPDASYAFSQTIPADAGGAQGFVGNFFLNQATLGFNIYWGTSGTAGWKHLVNIYGGAIYIEGGNGNMVFLTCSAGAVGTDASMWGSMSLSQNALLSLASQTGGVDLAPITLNYPSTSDGFIRYNGNRTIGLGQKANGEFMVFDYTAGTARFMVSPDGTFNLYGYVVATDLKSNGNVYCPNGYAYFGGDITTVNSIYSQSTGDAGPSTTTGFINGRWIRFRQNGGDANESGTITYRVYDSNSLCIVGVGASGDIRRVKIWDNVTITRDLIMEGGWQYFMSGVHARWNNSNNSTNLEIFDDGNSHIESTTTLWLNSNGNRVVSYGIIRSQGTMGGFEVGDRSQANDYTIYAQSGALRFYTGGDKWRCETSGVVYNYNHLAPTVDNAYWCGVDAWGVSWYVVSCYNAHNPSDRRLKRDIIDLPDCLQIVDRLSPRRYFMINDPEEDKWRRHWGFVAQEVGEVMDEAGYDFDSGYYRTTNPHNGEEVHSLNYNDIVACLWKAVQELSAKVKQLESRM